MNTEEILNQFPPYDGNPKNYVGSREYWESIFEEETNRNPELHIEFDKLHTKIVNMVIQFCKEHNLKNVNEFSIHADGIIGSIEDGEWCPCTDSSMSIFIAEIKDGLVISNREEPFLNTF